MHETSRRDLYGGLGLRPMVPRVMYQNPTVDPPDSTIPRLGFFSKLDRASGIPLTEVNEANRHHGMHLARMPGFHASAGGASTKTVLVKFTENYNEDAHRLLTDKNLPLAPALYHSMRVVGGLYMVVMEYVSSAKDLHRFFVPPHLSPLLDVDAIRRDLTRALDLLHRKNFVFGDLRPPNVLYSPEENRAFLIDFDWVGKHEEERYPTCLDTGGPGLGVHQWEIMKKSHDRVNSERLMGWLSGELAALQFLAQS